MSKPQFIDRHQCHAADKEEKYKDLTALDYWWGLRELAADFDIAYYSTVTGEDISRKLKNEITYIQLLHYTVEVKLAGAYYQMEQMERIFSSPLTEDTSMDIRVFEAKEAFDALHGDLYQSVCAIANELFMLFNRKQYKPTKYDHSKPIAMSPSDIRYWLKTNKHPHCKTIVNNLTQCENILDIRHHATHYGAVPVFGDINTGVLYIQKDFKIGALLTKYDIVAFKRSGGSMDSILEASIPRVKAMCKQINKLYRYIYSSDILEHYMSDKGVLIIDSYKPYWK